ncbi:MAG: SDR family oxidoreductase [Elusimicrobia bacterium]|nr:SDR family oxidoreductase [Elusimicrobiota bacterium]
MDLKGKTALLTGGAGGIGRAVASRLARAGTRVVLWDVQPQALQAAVEEISKDGFARGYPVDITDRRQVFEAAERVRREIGLVDILDNNAGVVFGGDFLQCSEEQILKTLRVNVEAVLWCTRAFLPGMLQRRSGCIVMMASAAGMLGVPKMAAYSASKHAVIGFAESLRLELRGQGHDGVRVLTVCPSFVKTGMFEGASPPMLTPWLDPGQLADKICDGIRRDRVHVREPFMVKLVPALKALPYPILDRAGDWLGLNSTMDHWQGRETATSRESTQRR